MTISRTAIAQRISELRALRRGDHRGVGEQVLGEWISTADMLEKLLFDNDALRTEVATLRGQLCSSGDDLAQIQRDNARLQSRLMAAHVQRTEAKAEAARVAVERDELASMLDSALDPREAAR